MVCNNRYEKLRLCSGGQAGSVPVDDADRCSPWRKSHVEKEDSLYEDFGEAAGGDGVPGILR